MLKFLLGVAVGYVLGAKAGRERYEQLKRTYQRISDRPAVRGAVGVVRAKAAEGVQGTAGAVRAKVEETVHGEPADYR